MTRAELFKELLAAMRDPARIGDVPALKSEFGGTRAFPAIEAKLDSVRGYAPPIDLDQLTASDPASFGHHYARFLNDNALVPIVPSGALDSELVKRNAFVVRYGIIHDMVHVLLNFDTSWPGEIGVWAFVGAQGYSRTFQVAGWAALFVAPFRCPWRLAEAWRCFRRGRAQAKQARLLLTERLEDRLSEPLERVRAELGIVV